MGKARNLIRLGDVISTAQVWDLEATAGVEPAIKVLQTSALPLGYVALKA